jgi:hypothetical protein
MPGPFTHIYAARRVAAFLSEKTEGGDFRVTDDFIRADDGDLLDDQRLDPALRAQFGARACAEFMNKWPKFTAVGAIGPDLFFWLQDYNNIAIPSDEIMLAMSLLYYLDDQGRLDDPYDGLLLILAEVNDTWASIFRFIVKLDQIWKKFLKVWDATIGPILEKAGQVVDDLSGGLFSALGDAFTELKNDVLNLAQEEILTEGDVFGWFSLKMRNGFDAQAFVWSDMTHYRRTSIVPTRLMAHARTMLASGDPLTKEHGEQLMAFALGWTCHVGTDVIGHSFVNEQCGGPFRTHWQRHHLIENHIDAWNYQCTGDGTLPADDFVGFQPTYPSVADSALYFAVQIPQGIDKLAPDKKQGDLRQPLPDATDKASRDQRAQLLDTDGELPLWLAETIVQVFIEIFADPATEGGDKGVQESLKEGAQPHPRNLLGQPFQDALHTGAAFAGLITKWMGILGIDNVGVALNDLVKQIAPDPPKTYPKGVPQGFPLPWEVQTAYRFMLSWFKRQYVATFDMDRPEPPVVFTPPASDYDFGPPDYSGVSASDDPVSKVSGAILATLDWLFKSLEKAAQFLYDVVKTAASAGSWPAREVIYNLVTLPAWQAAENIRRVLVHLGYVIPQSEQHYADGNLRRPNEIDNELITLGHTVDSAFQEALAAAWDPLGNLDKDPALTNVGVRDVLGADNPWLPVRVTKGQKPPGIFSLFTGNDVDEYQRPWAFPDRTNDPNAKQAGNYLETPLTIAGPYLTDTLPHSLMALGSPVSNPARSLYEAAGCPVDTDLYNLAFIMHRGGGGLPGEREYRGTNPLGDPVVFSTYLIGQISNNPRFLSSFNLDADRGYGYLCWDWERNPKVPSAAPDGMNHYFASPVTWPEGAPPGDPTVPPTPAVAYWTRPAPAPVGPNLYNLAMRLQYPGRECVQPPPGEPPGEPPGGLR